MIQDDTNSSRMRQKKNDTRCYKRTGEFEIKCEIGMFF